MASMYHSGGPGRPPAPPPPSSFPLQQQPLPLPPPPPPPSSFRPAPNPTLPSVPPNQFPPPPHYHSSSYLPPPPRPPPNFNQIPQNYASAPAHFPQQYTYPHLPPPPDANPQLIPPLPPAPAPLPPPPPLPVSAVPQYYLNSQYPQFHPPPSSPPPPPMLPSDPPPPPPNPPAAAKPVQAKPKERVVVQKPGTRVGTEEERRIRKRKEYERQRMEEKQRRMMESQATVLHKTNLLSSGGKVHASVTGPRAAERKAPFLSADRVENRLKKPTTFLCKLKFRNELPDTTAQPKLLTMNTNKDRYTRFSITSLEKMHKPKLFHEPDLGIPLDLLDISVYNTPSIRPPLAPEDEELLRDGDVATPAKLDGIRRKERPTDKGVSWLVKTQYISPISLDSAKQSITEKQAKELRETREGRNLFLENLNNREKQIQAIEESFKASKLRPVHQTKPSLEPVEICPLLPDFDRYEERFVSVAFDGDPTADSEIYSKLGRDIRDEVESKAVMKSFVIAGSDSSKPEKFLAYLVPNLEELSKDMFDKNEDMNYSWVREYHWDVRGDDVEGPTTYLVHFDEETARYLPLPTKLVLQKKKAKEGRSADDADTHYPVPSRVTVRRTAAAFIDDENEHEYANSKRGISSSKRGRSPVNGGHEKRRRILHDRHSEHFSGDDISD